MFLTWIPLVAYDRRQIQSGFIQKIIVDHIDEKFQRFFKNPKYRHLIDPNGKIFSAMQLETHDSRMLWHKYGV